MEIANNLLFESLFDTLPTGMLLFETDGAIVRMNLKAKEILGLEPEFTPNHLEHMAMGENYYLKPLVTLLCSGLGDVGRAELPLQLPTREEESTIGYSLKRVALPEGSESAEMKAFTFSDITHVLKDQQVMDKIKDELSQSKRLAAMGTMIAGVAHEMNNPLTGISMSASLLKMNLERLKKLPVISGEAKVVDNMDKALHEIQKVARECERAAVLVNDLLSYGKPVQFFFVTTVLHDLVADTVNALKTHPKFKQFSMRLPEKRDTLVYCDRIKLEQVFYNLIKNACDATDGKGTLTISYNEFTDSAGKSFVSVHVRDNGPGIKAADMAHIFDPFFTTKGHGGVGLGLSICYRTMELHGGMLSVESSPGEGTEFKVTLPLYLEGESEQRVLSP